MAADNPLNLRPQGLPVPPGDAFDPQGDEIAIVIDHRLIRRPPGLQRFFNLPSGSVIDGAKRGAARCNVQFGVYHDGISSGCYWSPAVARRLVDQPHELLHLNASV